MRTSSNASAEVHDDFLDLEASAKDIGCGVRWLRDGANRYGFPHDRYGKALWFSRQQRTEIRAMHRVATQPALHAGIPRPRPKRSAHSTATKQTALAPR